MSNQPPSKILRSDNKIYMIEYSTHQIVGAKLPSKRQVLQVFFHNRNIGLDEGSNIQLVIAEVLIFWQKAHIPTSKPWYCEQKLYQLYQKWFNLSKSKSRRTAKQIENETEFLDELDDLFDIAAVDALTQIKNDDDKAFLIAQRKKGREGCLVGVDVKGQKKEEKKQERIEAEERRREKAEAERESYLRPVQYDFDDDDDINVHVEENDEEIYEPSTSRAVRIPKKNIYTTRLFGALDKCEVTDRDAVHVITAVLAAVELNVKEYICSYSSLKTHREKYREELAKKFKENAKVLM